MEKAENRRLLKALQDAQAQIHRLQQELNQEKALTEILRRENDTLREALTKRNEHHPNHPNEENTCKLSATNAFSTPEKQSNFLDRRKRGRTEKGVENTQETQKPSKHDLNWQERFNELQRFQQMHGHCNVPLKKSKHEDPQWAKLASWVSTQRTQHKLLRTGQWTTLKPERVRLLTSLGFQWTLGPHHSNNGGGDTGTLTFAERVSQLEQYKLHHGDCNVPQKYEGIPGLGNFVLDQRKYYRRGKLPQSKIDQLEQLGFQWSLRNRGGTLEDRMKRAQEKGAVEEDDNKPGGNDLHKDEEEAGLDTDHSTFH